MDNPVVAKAETIYDVDSDILRLQFIDTPSVQSVEVAEGIVMDYDEKGYTVAIEVEDASIVLREFTLRAKATTSRISRPVAGDS